MKSVLRCTRLRPSLSRLGSIQSTKTVTLRDDSTGKEWKFPVLSGTLGPDVIDVRKLYAQADLFTYDPGYTSTGSCESAITYIDGDKGVLLHRGYPIEQLASQSDYLEVCYLLLNGELPNAQQKAEFTKDIMSQTMVHEKIREFLCGFRRDSHPMAIMVGVVGALSAFYGQQVDIRNKEHRRLVANRLIAKLPTIAAWAYKYSLGEPFMYPRTDLSFSENFLYMMFGTPCSEYKVNPVLAKATDRLMILHADHEQNASTSTVRMAGSSGANPYASIAAGIASLWGPAHGGANEAVLAMLKEIGSLDKIPEFVSRAKSKNDHTRLMGFGHRVYKNYDPRAKIMAQSCHEVLGVLGLHNDLLPLAMELERISLSDPYFVQKKLYPNVDFYSGIVLNAIGIPTNMYTVLFAISRCVGWIAHWNESLESPEFKISRPRQLYIGSTQRDIVPIDKRK